MVPHFFEQVVVLEDWGLHLVVAPVLKELGDFSENLLFMLKILVRQIVDPVGHKPAEALHGNQSFVKFPTLYHKRSWKGVNSVENAVRRTHIYVFCAATALFWFAMYTYVPILTPYVEHLGGSLSMAGMVVGAYGLTQMLVRILWALLLTVWAGASPLSLSA